MAFVAGVGLVDDLDGSSGQIRPVWIGLEGQLHEVDLNAQHRRQLLRLLRWYARRARVVPTDADDAGLGTSGALSRSQPRSRHRRQDVRTVLVDVVACEELSGEERHQLAGEMQVQARVILAMSERAALFR